MKSTWEKVGVAWGVCGGVEGVGVEGCVRVERIDGRVARSEVMGGAGAGEAGKDGGGERSGRESEQDVGCEWGRECRRGSDVVGCASHWRRQGRGVLGLACVPTSALSTQRPRTPTAPAARQPQATSPLPPAATIDPTTIAVYNKHACVTPVVPDAVHGPVVLAARVVQLQPNPHALGEARAPDEADRAHVIAAPTRGTHDVT